MTNKEMEYWEKEYQRCKHDAGYFYQQYFVVKRLYELKDVQINAEVNKKATKGKRK